MKERGIMPIALQKVAEDDIVLLNALQRSAFAPLVEKYGDEGNPGREPIERTREKMLENGYIYYLVMLGDAAIGGINFTRDAEDRGKIHQMFILPDHQNRGYAQGALLGIEAQHPEIKIWELDTIKQEEKLCRLYEKMGYARTGREMALRDDMTIIDYRKEK